ncbi:MAG: hypothetical protein MUF65_09430 [Rubritepida sp.]|nr:hypothetical protein [Rubritepida sp.]
MEGALLNGLAMGARSAALGSAAFLLIAATPATEALARRVTLIAAGVAGLLALAALPVTTGAGGWIGAVLALAAAGGMAALAWRGGEARILVALGLPLLLGGILQSGAHGAVWPFLATLLREAGAALWMGSLPLLWFALGREGALDSARRHRLLALGGIALALPGVLLAAGTAAVPPGAAPLLLATALLLLALLAATLWQSTLVMGTPTPARLRALTELAILLAIALCAPIAALFAGAAPGAVWPAVPALLLAAALLALAVLPVPALASGVAALALVAAGTLALAANAPLPGVLAIAAGGLRWLAWRGEAGVVEARLAGALWAGLAAALLPGILLTLGR